MATEHPTVFVVEDDQSVRDSITDLLASVGLPVETFGTAQDFFDRRQPDGPTCLVLDVRLPGASGLDVQRELTRTNVAIPIIFITGHGDVPMSVQAMKAGAIEFLTKPFRDQVLLDAIQEALDRDRVTRRLRTEMEDHRRRYDSLTRREREIMTLVVDGKLNKQIAAELGTSEVTVKVHRARVMQKMEAKSLADLVKVTERLGTATPRGLRPGIPRYS